MSSYRHESGHYIVVPRAENTLLQPLAREMEFLGEMGVERFAADVQAKILKGGLAGSAFVCLSRREFMRDRGRPSDLDPAVEPPRRWFNNRKSDVPGAPFSHWRTAT
ncbi:hypothetical protein AB4059_05990 [Lysobacter sp. 2RAF19]